MKIYIDSEFHCHTTNPDGLFREVERAFFNGKCSAFVEGHIFLPEDCEMTINGTTYKGEMITLWKPDSELAAAQAQYEADLAAAAAAYQEGVDSAYDT